ncbi:hypothetical protein QYF61_004508 [Mycteria americana]|uniref:Core shell protein Gag P30 domain-containing protein n=1 Tax=Mycteria americana TaxID=33587 RepID=A0AAN7RP95_MYCAM|nr:hypothetical protein QYF61_004508 [Mycteria americana]
MDPRDRRTSSRHRGILGENLRSPDRRALSKTPGKGGCLPIRCCESPTGLGYKALRKSGGGDPLTRKQLIEYCNNWQSTYILEDQEKWPKNGTLRYNTILQLMLFCRQEGKWDEVPYADLFFTLRNHPEWQKQCGMIPQDSIILTLEKQGRNKTLGKGCLKRGQEEDDLEFTVAPRQRLGENPDWNDLQVILDTLLDGTEKKMVLNTAQKQVEGAHANGDLQGTIDQNFPATDPEWDPNQPGPPGAFNKVSEMDTVWHKARYAKSD